MPRIKEITNVIGKIKNNTIFKIMFSIEGEGGPYNGGGIIVILFGSMLLPISFFF